MPRHRSTLPPGAHRPPRRRDLLAWTAAATGYALTGCAAPGVGAAAPAPTDPLPSGPPPPDTRLSIASRRTQLQLTASGQLDELPFTVAQWPNLSAGPDVIQGFRAGSIDLAVNAGLPPIQARAIGLDTRIVAVQYQERPLYHFATAPGTNIRRVRDFRGRRIAFSQGQAQGAVVLRALAEVGLGARDVQLVELTSPQFLTALQSRQVDVAPLSEPALTRYLDRFRRDGARLVRTDVVDLLSVLWAPGAVLRDEAKAAAVRSFLPFWVRGTVWEYEHPERWNTVYYVRDQEVSAADGRRIAASLGAPAFPRSWEKAIAWEQDTADLLAENGFVPRVRAEDLFDRRFEPIAAQSAPAAYRR